MKKIASFIILMGIASMALAQTTATPSNNGNSTKQWNFINVGSNIPLTTAVGPFVISDPNGQSVIERFGTIPPAVLFYTADGSRTSPTGKAQGESLGPLQWRAYYGLGYTTFASASIDAVLAQTPSATVQGASLVFKNSHINTATLPISGYFNGNGGFGVGNTVKQLNYMYYGSNSAFTQ